MGTGDGSWTTSAQIFIGIGVALGAIAIIAPILFLTKWRKQHKEAMQEEAVINSEPQTEMEEFRVKMRSQSRQSTRSMRLDGHQVPYRSASPAVDYHFPTIPSRASSRLSTRQSSVTLDGYNANKPSYQAAQDLYLHRDSWRASPDPYRMRTPQRASYHARPTRESGAASPDITGYRNARWSAPDMNTLVRHDTVRSKHRAYPSVIHETPAAAQAEENETSEIDQDTFQRKKLPA